LIDMLTNNLINKQDRYQGEFKIQKLAEDAYEDIYLVTAQITHSTNKSIHQKTGRGQIFKINQGLELIYTEEEQTEKVGTLHYQYKIEALEPTGKLLTVINCNTRTIERCFLVAEDFKIDQAEQMDMESKKRQSLFKLK
ncbi:MAG: hypothetical protein PUB18_06400, partial [bacterium]|nr:hypothetical protein [bacterium]